MSTWTIADLASARDTLTVSERARFDRLYTVDVTTGKLGLPDPMVVWVEKTYGTIDTVVEQQIVKVTNLWTLQTSLFNPFRARRPQKGGDSDSLAAVIFGEAPDPFDQPESNTSEDTFGRVRGEHCMTAGNLAKSDSNHGVIIFNEHNPWLVTEDAFWDAIKVAEEWFRLTRQHQPEAIYPLLIWNCLWKAGASINHAHMQLLMTCSMHYGEIERLRRVDEQYRQTHKTSYFDDLYAMHDALGLAARGASVRALAHLTPLLSCECMLFSDGITEAFARTIHRVIRLLNEQLDVTSFNLALYPHPLAETREDWSHMPVIARIVNRGDPRYRTIDTGALELFAASVISSDPFELGRLIQTLDIG